MSNLLTVRQGTQDWDVRTVDNYPLSQPSFSRATQTQPRRSCTRGTHHNTRFTVNNVGLTVKITKFVFHSIYEFCILIWI